MKKINTIKKDNHTKHQQKHNPLNTAKQSRSSKTPNKHGFIYYYIYFVYIFNYEGEESKGTNKNNKKQINPTRYFRERNSGYGLILRLVSRFQEGCAKQIKKSQKKEKFSFFFFLGVRKRERRARSTVWIYP